METVDRSFLGTGWSFPPAFRREWYGLEMLKEVEDVRSSIEIILKTITGERVMLPTFGCNLQPYVFESMDPPLIALMEKIVLDALAIHEPRIIVAGILSTPDVLNGKLDMNVQFDIIATNTRTNYVFPFYMKEATNIET